jgi:hypothetical protein
MAVHYTARQGIFIDILTHATKLMSLLTADTWADIRDWLRFYHPGSIIADSEKQLTTELFLDYIKHLYDDRDGEIELQINNEPTAVDIFYFKEDDQVSVERGVPFIILSAHLLYTRTKTPIAQFFDTNKIRWEEKQWVSY